MVRKLALTIMALSAALQLGCDAESSVTPLDEIGPAQLRSDVERTPTMVAASRAEVVESSLVDVDGPLVHLFPVTSGHDAPATTIRAEQSTTGPRPPASVAARDLTRKATARGDITGGRIIDDVPAYNWRHGCGPTAVGMVIGYYDGNGFDLIPGDADTQTADVDQAIASGGRIGNPFPAGSEQHFEDYSMPIDDGTPSIIDDAYITAARSTHVDNCIADYMDTSKSTRSNRYGWSWSSDIVPAFEDYVAQVAPALTAEGVSYFQISWETVTEEIDNDRPMVFLVDTNGDNGTDHFITVIGYREIDGNREYASLDTWSATVRWEDFAYMASGQPWGVRWGYTFSIASDDECVANWQCDDGELCNGVETCTDGVCEDGVDYGAACYDATYLKRYENSGSFDTTGEKWFYITDEPNGWWAANIHGRSIYVNGQEVSIGEMPLPAKVDDGYYFQFTEGVYPFTSFGFW